MGSVSVSNHIINYWRINNMTNLLNNKLFHENQGVIEKACQKCKEIYPATIEYFYRNKNINDGFYAICKKCRSDYYRNYNKKNKSEISKKRSAYYRNNKNKFIEYRNKNRNKINKCIKAYMNKPVKYSTYANRLKYFEFIKESKDGLLEIECTYCGKTFKPTANQVLNRIKSINGDVCGENRFYCSNGCKESCPTFHKQKFPEGFKKATSREANPQLRQLVLKRDNYTCQKCGTTECLHCHHVVPATQNPMTANDPDVCITLCKACHKEVHMQDGCKYHELKCNK